MKAILLMFDSLNKNYLPNYGCEWVKAPNFMRLGEKAMTFDNFFIGSAPCIPARRELHTGRLNFLHRSWGPLEPFDFSMPQALKENGVYTHLISDHFHYFEDGGATYHSRYNTWDFIRGQQGDPWIGKVADPVIPECENPRKFNLANWRQDWVNREVMKDESDQPLHKSIDRGLDFINKNAGEESWFLQLELFDPHEPFYTMDKYKDMYPHEYNGKHYDWINYGPADKEPLRVNHLKNEYAALVSMCDEYLGRVIDTMDELDLWKDTMLIVNTDHGLMLGEKEWYGKNIQPFYNEISNIPFFIHDPRSAAEGGRRQSLCQTIDIAPTVLEYFGVDIPGEVQGKPLYKTLDDEASIRDAALFGIHGGHVNVVDNKYIYMRANTTPDNKPLNNYTLMPTHMREFFPIEEIRGVSIAKRGTFNFIDCDVMKIPSASILSSDVYGHLLFDRENDPNQENPLEDKDVELNMAKKMIVLMEENECPEEQFKRLGLSKKKKLKKKDLNIVKKQKLGIDTPIGKLMEDAAARAVLEKYFKDALNHPKFDMAKGISIVKLKRFAKGMITDEMISNIEKDLNKLRM